MSISLRALDDLIRPLGPSAAPRAAPFSSLLVALGQGHGVGAQELSDVALDDPELSQEAQAAAEDQRQAEDQEAHGTGPLLAYPRGIRKQEIGSSVEFLRPKWAKTKQLSAIFHTKSHRDCA